MGELAKERHTFTFGDVTITVDAPAGLDLSIGLDTHSHAGAEQFHRTIAAAGGLGTFEPIKPDNCWFSTPTQRSGDVDCHWTVFVPDEVARGDKVAHPGMVDLKAKQDALVADDG